MYFYWQLGAVTALQEAIPFEGVQLSGASAGALTAALAACNVDLRASVDLAYKLAVEAELFTRPQGLAGVWGPIIRRWLHELLPANAADLCRGRVHIYMLQVWPQPGQRPPVSDFATKEELIDALLASVHIPFFLDGKPWSKFRGARCVDGSIAAPRDVVDLTKSGLLDVPALLVDHIADPVIAARTTATAFVELTTYEGLTKMVSEGYAYMSSEVRRGVYDGVAEAARAEVQAQAARRPAPSRP